ncbi:endonuclease NucS domain-containing protein [Methanocaldococcus sp. 28A]
MFCYYLIAVSNRENLEICKKELIAGFPSSKNGFWTYLEIKEGDYISFLYGAKIYNLYRVSKKIVNGNIEDSKEPWGTIVFQSGKEYTFPFRLLLEQIREFEESLVKPEFVYIAENLLLRGGYRKTHFQADETTLNVVSKLGKMVNNKRFNHKWLKQSITPKITFNKKNVNPPFVYLFEELILHVLVKQYMGGNLNGIFNEILNSFNINENYHDFEVLSEKALPSGHVDLLIKKKHPVERDYKIVVEVKKNKAGKKEVEQLIKYMGELEDCVGGILIAKDFARTCFKHVKDKKVLFIKYHLKNLDDSRDYTFLDLLNMLSLNIICH